VPGVRHDALSTANKTPLMEAACRGRVQCLSILLQHRCSVHDKNERGRTALHYCLLPAIGTLDPDDMMSCLDMLFSHGADVSATDVGGCTPLHIALATENVEAVTWLLRHNCDLDTRATLSDLAPGVLSCLTRPVAVSPVLLAVHFSNRRLVQLLVACGARCQDLAWALPHCAGYELLHQFLLRSINNPQSLQTLCRNVVRRAVGRHVDDAVRSLAVPPSVQRYLLLTEEISTL
jgi:hypothetical protein